MCKGTSTVHKVAWRKLKQCLEKSLSIFKAFLLHFELKSLKYWCGPFGYQKLLRIPF